MNGKYCVAKNVPREIFARFYNVLTISLTGTSLISDRLRSMVSSSTRSLMFNFFADLVILLPEGFFIFLTMWKMFLCVVAIAMQRRTHNTLHKNTNHKWKTPATFCYYLFGRFAVSLSQRHLFSYCIFLVLSFPFALPLSN